MKFTYLADMYERIFKTMLLFKMKYFKQSEIFVTAQDLFKIN